MRSQTVQTENALAAEEDSVRSLYQDEEVARDYIAERLKHSWWRHLHRTQVESVNQVIRERGTRRVLEVAPGPARLTTEIKGVEAGVMVEASPQMINVARGRLEEAGVAKYWEVREGNAFDLSPLAQSFDFAYTFRFIRHFHSEERQRFYREVHGRLNTGGYLMFDMVGAKVRDKLDVQTEADGGQQGLQVYDVTYRGRKEIETEVNAAGFELVQLTPVLNHFFLQRMLSHRLDRRLGAEAVTRLIGLLDQLPGAHPLEWVALLKKV